MKAILSSAVFVALTPLVAGAAPVTKAVATLAPTKGSTVAGHVSFVKVDGGVKVTAHISGLTPGLHGFHIHEFGDCSAADGSSAGGHFNPAGHPHGGPKDAERHAGDLGNIEAGKDGVATLDVVDAAMTLEGSSGILGGGVIVHEKADDLKTQPTGNAGGRLSCGVIGAAKPE
jgi:superoxide dismutase, Cu-Zn family